MERGNGRGRDDFFGFGDPFSGFGGFSHPGNLMSSFFGGRDPFDDPFFTRPFESMMGPSILGRNMFGPSMFGPSIFDGPSNAGFLEQQPSRPSESKGPIIKELNSDDEEVDNEGNNPGERKDNPRKHSRSSAYSYVQDPEEEAEEKKSKLGQYWNQYDRTGRGLGQPQTYTYHSSTVTYGGPNGAYYTSSTTRRAGDGVTVEESKEADSTTGKASHRVSRGIHEKGHSVTRKLNSDGRVDTTQILHNLDEDELTGFDEAWKGKAKKHLPGWKEGFDMLGNGDVGGSSRNWNEQQRSNRGWQLPSAEQANVSGNGRLQQQNFNRRAS